MLVPEDPESSMEDIRHSSLVIRHSVLVKSVEPTIG